MCRCSRSNTLSRSRRGFTLLEAMVSLLILVLVLIIAMTMLFQMRAFAERQQYFMLPRQAARRATDYLSYYIAGASDLNYDAASLSPNALVTYYNLGGVLTQASYNNVTDPKLADVGTDILTMVAPFNPSRYQVSAPFPTPLGTGQNLNLNFRVGCGATDDDAANMAAFQAATGFDGTQSALLMLVDKTGSWSYLRIPKDSYKGSLCSDHSATPQNIQLENVDTAALASLPEPPNGVRGLTDPVSLVVGLQVISFRVLTDPSDGIPKLQQKLGLFDPGTDSKPGSSFTNVMENVEDLQIAYMYTDGQIWNTVKQSFDAATKGVPPQAGPNAAVSALDASNVIGLRFSVTGRSPLLPLAARQMTNVDVRESLANTTSQHFRPASEDHLPTDPPQYDQCDHYRATTTLMLRNRIPRG